MGMIKIIPKHCPHPGKPPVEMHGIGSVWECDNPVCRRRFTLRESQRDGLYWEEQYP